MAFRKQKSVRVFPCCWSSSAARGSLTVAFFLVLPLIQAISKSPLNDLSLNTVDAATLPPPPPPPPRGGARSQEPEEEPGAAARARAEHAAARPLAARARARSRRRSSGGWGRRLRRQARQDVGSGGGAKETTACSRSIRPRREAPRDPVSAEPGERPHCRKAPAEVIVTVHRQRTRARREPDRVQKSSDSAFDRPCSRLRQEVEVRARQAQGQAGARSACASRSTFPKS